MTDNAHDHTPDAQRAADEATVAQMRELLTPDPEQYDHVSIGPWTWDDKLSLVMSPESDGDTAEAVISSSSWGNDLWGGCNVVFRMTADRKFVLLSRPFADAALRTIDRLAAENRRLREACEGYMRAIQSASNALYKIDPATWEETTREVANKLGGAVQSADWFAILRAAMREDVTAFMRELRGSDDDE